MRVDRLTYAYPEQGLRLRLKRRPDSAPLKAALRDVSLEIHEHRVALVGESGCGKSTLIKSWVGLLEKLDESRVWLEGTCLSEHLAGDGLAFRRAVQVIFQHSDTFLNPKLKARLLLDEALRLKGEPACPLEEHAIGKKWMGILGITSDHLEKSAGMLSGGEKKRIGILRCMLVDPRLIIADEPFSGVDVSYRNRIIEAFEEEVKEHGKRFLIVTHEIEMVKRFAERVIVMYGGQVVDDFPIGEIRSPERHPYTKAICLSQEAILDKSLQDDPRLVRLVDSQQEVVVVDRYCTFRTRCSDRQPQCESVEIPRERLPRCLLGHGGPQA